MKRDNTQLMAYHEVRRLDDLGTVAALRLTADGHICAVISSNEVLQHFLSLVDVARGSTPVATLDITNFTGLMQRGRIVSMSATGRTLLLDLGVWATPDEFADLPTLPGEVQETLTRVSVFVWREDTNTLEHLRHVPGEGFSAALTADGERMAVVWPTEDERRPITTNDQVHVFRVSDGALLWTRQLRQVFDLRFHSPDVLLALHHSSPTQCRLTRLWETQEEPETVLETDRPNNGHVRYVIAPSGDALAVFSDNGLEVRVLTPGREDRLVLPTLNNTMVSEVLTVAFQDGDDHRLVIVRGNQDVWVWDHRRAIETSFQRVWEGGANVMRYPVKISDDGSTVVYPDADWQLVVVREESRVPPTKSGRFMA